MKVKAKWAIKVDGAWHMAGDVFETEDTGLLSAVDVLEVNQKPVKAPSEDETTAEPEAEEKPKTRTRKKVAQ